MSDILIKNMGMPEKQVYVILNPNGLVEVLDANNVLLEEYQAVRVPPHGRLVDENNLLKEQLIFIDGSYKTSAVRVMDICNSPTILEAKEDE